jgi:hypothetical protein
MPLKPAMQAALAAEGRTYDASGSAGKDLIRASLGIQPNPFQTQIERVEGFATAGEENTSLPVV